MLNSYHHPRHVPSIATHPTPSPNPKLPLQLEIKSIIQAPLLFDLLPCARYHHLGGIQTQLLRLDPSHNFVGRVYVLPRKPSLFEQLLKLVSTKWVPRYDHWHVEDTRQECCHLPCIGIMAMYHVRPNRLTINLFPKSSRHVDDVVQCSIDKFGYMRPKWLLWKVPEYVSINVINLPWL